MSSEIVALNELITAARDARDQRLFDRAKAAFDRDNSAESIAGLGALLHSEALALTETMIELDRPNIFRYLGRHSIGMSKKEVYKIGMIGGSQYLLTSPILFPIQKELVGGQEITHGYRFETLVQYNPTLPRHFRRQALAVDVYSVTQELTEELEEAQQEFSVWVYKPQPGKAQFESRLVPAIDDEINKILDQLENDKLVDENQIYEQYALLRLAREELGDKRAF
jgi:hypothetical protein